jgi:hypothetical protein
MAEIGAYGYEPQPGDPFIFAHRNLPTCTWMTDVTGILGGIVAGDHGNCLAIVGAGGIDADGNVNSSRTASGGYLVGSGGANDIASGAEAVIVVVKHGKNRLVEEVEFVTSPGSRVRGIVTDQAVLERSDGEGPFVVTRIVRRDPDELLDDAITRVLQGVGWPVKVSADVRWTDPVLMDDVLTLRSFDPRNSFLPPATKGSTK